MGSALFSVANRLRSALRFRHWSSSYCTKRAPPRPSLQSTIWPLGHPSISLVPEIERWIDKGNSARPVELQNVVRELRKRRRFKQALEVSEWMKNKSKITFMPSDHAVQLDLIGEVHGSASAETYFNSLDEKNKTEKTYGALLNCYVRERQIEKSLSHMKKMKEMGLAFSPLPYNDIMCLYTNTGQHEKVPSVLAEMKNNGVYPDNFSYRICINSYGTRSDIYGMEKVLEEMEHQPQIVVDWNTYAVVASIYIKAELVEKAVSALKKAEEKLDKRHGPGYNHLISLYGHLENKSEMRRLWDLQKENCKKYINRDYTTMLGGLVKLGELEEAEALLKEWESSGNALDFRVPNVLLTGYRHKGLLEKAEALLDDFVKKGKTPPSSSWGIVATGYAEKGEIEKAHELMKNALCVYVPNTGWGPNAAIVKSILNHLSEQGDLKEVETFIGLLRIAVPMDREMYHTLIRARTRAGREVDDLLKSMKDDGIEENKETKEILSLKS
ncbi:pentatricopeptide repeat-containing protein At4g21705, mitochondrial-like [Ananas comosus]|uniref:Pentatricopeptide repeat-containing protein At4g21705, mitochondrial-like n=1 Tax=Ananas comosus TaxID=4615 RepID=A0A6P5FK09_ANACO|nr:pentatricopeptide repeat-containing protein At4g21705, mitochondrial-like [Ananas comosus]